MTEEGELRMADLDHERARRLGLEIEMRELHQRLIAREQSLAELNRRVVELERGGRGTSDVTSLVVRNHELEREVHELTAELDRLRSTKLFRWARPARTLYGVFRGLSTDA